MESPTAFCPTNGMRDHPYMHPDDLPRRNLRHLIATNNTTATDAGNASGAGQSWVSRYLNEAISKPNATKMGQLAAHFGVPVSDLMWKDLSATGDTPASQPVGSEHAIVAAAVKLTREIESVWPEPMPAETYADRLFIAMKVVREEGAEGVLDESKLLGAIRRFSAELRKTG